MRQAFHLGAFGGGFMQHQRGLQNRLHVHKAPGAVKELFGQHVRMPGAEQKDRTPVFQRTGKRFGAGFDLSSFFGADLFDHRGKPV